LAIVYSLFSAYINKRNEIDIISQTYLFGENMQNSVTFPPAPQAHSNFFNAPNPVATNPLAMYMRQPKIYMRLPTNGQFWPTGSIDLPENGQLAVYSMTAKDELLLNIPDALMNGQAVVDIIQNCVPGIKNAWHAPVNDIDALLIAIRIATYGEMMSTPVKVREDLEMDYQVDLRMVLDKVMGNYVWDPVVPISDTMTAFVRPATYKQSTEVSVKSYETQKIMTLVNDEDMSEDEKVRLFKESFAKLTQVTLNTVASCIERIDTPEGSTSNKSFIIDFLNNSDKSTFNKIQNHLDQLKDANSIKNMQVPVTDEMRTQGITSDIIEIPLVFDASTFFV
jgi:hypothetical protein